MPGEYSPYKNNFRTHLPSVLFDLASEVLKVLFVFRYESNHVTEFFGKGTATIDEVSLLCLVYDVAFHEGVSIHARSITSST